MKMAPDYERPHAQARPIKLTGNARSCHLRDESTHCGNASGKDMGSKRQDYGVRRSGGGRSRSSLLRPLLTQMTTPASNAGMSSTKSPAGQAVD